jgi:hypothetical protein
MADEHHVPAPYLTDPLVWVLQCFHNSG